MIESLDGNHVSFYITKKVFTYIPYVCNAAGTKQNTPNTSDKLSTFKAAMTTNQSRLAAKRGKEMKNRKKSLNQVRKRLYQKAVLILGKIAMDQAAGTLVDEDKIKRKKKIVYEYENFLKKKQIKYPVEIIKQADSQKTNHSQND